MKKRQGKRPLKRQNPEWQHRKDAAEKELIAVRDAARVSGLTVTVSEVASGRTTFPHWQFRHDGGVVVLHWWPTNGKYRTIDGARGQEFDAHEMLRMARWMIGED